MSFPSSQDPSRPPKSTFQGDFGRGASFLKSTIHSKEKILHVRLVGTWLTFPTPPKKKCQIGEWLLNGCMICVQQFLLNCWDQTTKRKTIIRNFWLDHYEIMPMMMKNPRLGSMVTALISKALFNEYVRLNIKYICAALFHQCFWTYLGGKKECAGWNTEQSPFFFFRQILWRKMSRLGITKYWAFNNIFSDKCLVSWGYKSIQVLIWSLYVGYYFKDFSFKKCLAPLLEAV